MCRVGSGRRQEGEVETGPGRQLEGLSRLENSKRGSVEL